MADHRGEAEPGLLLQAQAEQGAGQDREQALEQVAEQSQAGQAFAGDPQHIGGAGVARATDARIRPTGLAAE
ncbi:hypothetical protein D3C86_1875450 [compost metagenome]